MTSKLSKKIKLRDLRITELSSQQQYPIVVDAGYVHLETTTACYRNRQNEETSGNQKII